MLREKMRGELDLPVEWGGGNSSGEEVQHVSGDIVSSATQSKAVVATTIGGQGAATADGLGGPLESSSWSPYRP